MIVYRISGNKYAHDIKGIGAAIYGGRWNKKGSPALYTGESIEIALLEMLVHTPPMLAPKLDLLKIEIPDSITAIKASSLPTNWKDYPAPAILAEISERWIVASKTIALKVPSCIIPSAHNFIINCRHSDFEKRVKIIEQEKFIFDTRLTS